MCSLAESGLGEEEGEELAPTRAGPADLTRCKKCLENKPSVNLRVRDVYCKQCFLAAVHHKFRATLGKHKAMKPGDKVCVGHSGGVASSVLLHLLKTGIESDHKKLLFHPMVLHVDEGCLLNLTVDQRHENIREVVSGVGELGFPLFVSLLEEPDQLYSIQDPSRIDIQFPEGLGCELLDCIDNIKENSAKEDFVHTLRRRALIAGAGLMGCTKVFTGDSSTKISIDLLAGVALGKGVNLSHETGFRDTRDPGVMVLRPLRDVSGKEIAFYARFHQISSVSAPNFSTGKESLHSIRKLTEDFLIGLQADFPGTLSTVFKTGDKLQVDTDETRDACVLCAGPVDTETEQHCALQATYWSLIVSSKGTKLGDKELCSSNLETLDLAALMSKAQFGGGNGGGGCGERTECCGEGDGSCGSSSSRPLRLDDVLPLLCYSCMRTVMASRRLETLPSYLTKEIQLRRNRSEMKREIQDFLL